MHAIGVKGHDIVKYALDTYGDDPRDLSCTHDANAWPADFYGGLPAPKDNERVILWIQNSHPCAIPSGVVGLNLMGHPETAWLDREIPAFGSYALDAADLLPDARWPEQIEVNAGKHFVRPRYEIETRDGGELDRRRTAHVNVERVDLEPNSKIAEIGNLMGKGFPARTGATPRAIPLHRPAHTDVHDPGKPIRSPPVSMTATGRRSRAMHLANCAATRASRWTSTNCSTARPHSMTKPGI